MKNPQFNAHLATWAEANGLHPCRRYPCAHSIRGRGHGSVTHRDQCIPLGRSLLANAHVLATEESRHVVLVCFPYAPRPGESGREVHRAAMEQYAALIAVQAFAPPRVKMQRLFSTDSTCDLYGPLDVDLDYPDQFLPTWSPTKTRSIW